MMFTTPTSITSDNASWLLILSVVCSAVVGLFLKKIRTRHFPPGPCGVPLLGYLPFLDCRRLHKSLLSLSRRHGDMFSLRIGGKTLVILNSTTAIREAFVEKASSFDGRPVWMLNKVNHGRGIANEQPTPKWQNSRKTWRSFMREMMRSEITLEDVVLRDIRPIVSSLSMSRGQPIDVCRTVRTALCNVICSVCFGESFSHDDAEFLHLLKMADVFFHHLSSASAVNFFPVLWHLPFGAHRAVAQGYDGIFDFVLKRVRERRNRKGGRKEALIDFLLAAESDTDIDVLRTDDLKATNSDIHETCTLRGGDDELCQSVAFVVTDLFVGGAETTHAGVMWALLFMLRNAEVQSRVQQELDTVLCNDRSPSWADRHNLPYTQATIQEILRLGNVIPIAIPHLTTHDVTMSNGYRLPKGTTVMANLYACHMDTSAWQSPKMFRPERFLEWSGELRNRCDDLMPFSIGRRVCLGEQLARIELFLAFTHIIQEFKISLAPGEQLPDIDGRPGITHSPRPFKMCAVPRHGKRAQ